MSKYINADRLGTLVEKTYGLILNEFVDGNSKLTKDGMLATYASFQTFLEMIRIAPSIDITEQEEENN